MSPTSELTTTAKEGTQNVLHSAGEQASALTHQTTEQVRDLMGEAKLQARDVSLRERDRLAGAMGDFNDELRQMAAAGTGGYASQLANQVLDRSSQLRERVSTMEPEQMVRSVETYARRRPGMFLAGALVAGFAVGRLVRSRPASSDTGDSSADGAEVALMTEPYLSTANGYGLAAVDASEIAREPGASGVI